MKELLFIIVSAISLSGCSLGRDVYVINLNPSKTIVTKTTTYSHTYDYKIKTDYKIRETRKSNIGSTMIKVEDNVLENVENIVVEDIVQDNAANVMSDVDSSSSVKTLYDISISGEFKTKKLLPARLRTVKHIANIAFDIVGKINVDDSLYYVINLGLYPYKFLVSKEGYFVSNKFLDLDIDSDDHHYHYSDIEMKTTPNIIKFDLVPQSDPKYQDNKHKEVQHDKYQLVDKHRYAPVINYELIYGGKDSTGLHIVYREFTGDGMARQAFFQNLNYENKAKTIRFKNTNIEVISADNEQIVFKVLEDDIFDLEKSGIDALPKNVSTKTVTTSGK